MSEALTQRPKILFVTANTPFPPIAGSSQRTSNLLSALGEFADVDIFILSDEKAALFLKQKGFSVAGNYKINKSFIQKLLSLFIPKNDYAVNKSLQNHLKIVYESGKYDMLVGRYLKPSVNSGISEIGPSYVDIDDLDTSVIANRIKSSSTAIYLRPILRRRLKYLNTIIDNLLSKFTGVILASKLDIELIKHENLAVVPNISFHAAQEQEYTPSKAMNILWVGSFNHRVNLEGLDYFITHHWNSFCKKAPHIRLRIVGSHLPDGYKRKWMSIPNIDVIGFVESLDEEYEKSAFSIVPIWDGAGTKIKVLESLSYNRTSVVTEHSSRGFEALVEKAAIKVAQNNEEFIEMMLELIDRDITRHQMEIEGNRIVKELYTKQALVASLHALMSRPSEHK